MTIIMGIPNIDLLQKYVLTPHWCSKLKRAYTIMGDMEYVPNPIISLDPEQSSPNTITPVQEPEDLLRYPLVQVECLYPR